MSVVICKSCQKKFDADCHGESVDFDQHDCPAVPDPLPGESFDDFAKRAEARRIEFMEERGI
jgi:hypothetical protein